mgnify:CR=1 FL=1
MYEDYSHLTLQEKDLKDFLCTLGFQLPAYSPNLPDEYVILSLGTAAAAVFKGRDGKAVLLGYRLDEITYPYVENILEAGLFEIGFARTALVLGTGAGLDAVCIALQHGIPVDATDINPVAVANTMVAARRCGVDNLVRAWVSDGFGSVNKKYDAIFFAAPLATDEAESSDVINRYDYNGRLLKSVLRALPAHLNPEGRMYLMSRPDLSPYFPANGLGSKALRQFTAKSSVAIHEIWKIGGPNPSHVFR